MRERIKFHSLEHESNPLYTDPRFLILIFTELENNDIISVYQDLKNPQN